MPWPRLAAIEAPSDHIIAHIPEWRSRSQQQSICTSRMLKGRNRLLGGRPQGLLKPPLDDASIRFRLITTLETTNLSFGVQCYIYLCLLQQDAAFFLLRSYSSDHWFLSPRAVFDLEKLQKSTFGFCSDRALHFSFLEASLYCQWPPPERDVLQFQHPVKVASASSLPADPSRVSALHQNQGSAYIFPPSNTTICSYCSS